MLYPLDDRDQAFRTLESAGRLLRALYCEIPESFGQGGQMGCGSAVVPFSLDIAMGAQFFEMAIERGLRHAPPRSQQAARVDARCNQPSKNQPSRVSEAGEHANEGFVLIVVGDGVLQGVQHGISILDQRIGFCPVKDLTALSPRLHQSARLELTKHQAGFGYGQVSLFRQGRNGGFPPRKHAAHEQQPLGIGQRAARSP